MTLPLEQEQNKIGFVEWLFKQQCEFIAGAALKEQLPPPSLPEYAFVGRSNVGKSSLLNSLVHRRQLARVSHTPGRTQQINFFSLGKRVLLVDLPGYGYSQVGRQRVKEWGKVIQWYLSNRSTLKRVFLLIDSRHPLKQLDQEAMAYLDSQALSFQVVLTKTDKGKVDPALLEELKKSQALFRNLHPTLILVSAKQKNRSRQFTPFYCRLFNDYLKITKGKIMMSAELRLLIEQAWEKRKNLESAHGLLDAIDQILEQLDQGKLRVAEKKNNGWEVNEWVKKALLLAMYSKPLSLLSGAPGKEKTSFWFDKIPPKFSSWQQEDFLQAQIRAVPGSHVRYSAYISPDVILMPSFINVGAYIGSGTMIDTWSTVGSCAQIGKNCHISGGVGIGGVLEPVQASPVIIEDNCFIGARSEIAEGVIIEEGSVIAMGVFLGASTKIIHRHSGEIFYGRVPAYSVVVPGTLPAEQGPSLGCAVIVKTVDEKTRAKTSLNELLRF